MMLDVQNMTDADLEKEMLRIQGELKERKCRREKEVWNSVVIAVRNYCEEFGEIRLAWMEPYENGICVDTCMDTPGLFGWSED